MTILSDTLLEQVGRSELIVFVGAGVSCNSHAEVDAKGWSQPVCPDNWEELLKRIAHRLELVDMIGGEWRPIDVDYEKVAASLGPLEMADYLYYLATRKHSVLDSDIASWIRRGVEEPEEGTYFQPNEWHDALLGLGEYGPRVTVTTNYDTLIERKFGSEGFKSYTYAASNLNNVLVSKKRPIFKLHGSIDDDSARLIFSSSDYRYLEHKGKLMLDVLRSLLMTRTALFVGYGLGDPDVNHVLSSIFTRHRGAVEPSHFILHEDSPMWTSRKEMIRDWYGVQSIPYAKGDHKEGLRILQEIGAGSLLG